MVNLLNIARTLDAESQIPDNTIAQPVAPSMNTQLLAPRPGLLDNTGMADIQRGLNDIQLCQQILLLFASVGEGIELLAVDRVQILDVPQPVVDHSKLFLGQRGSNTSAAIVSANDDMADLEDVDGVLEDRQQVHVGVGDHVGDVAVDENLAGIQVDDLVCRHTRIRAAYIILNVRQIELSIKCPFISFNHL